MPYTKTNWQDDVTPLSAANLNKLEQGVADAHALNVDNVTVSDTTAPTGDTAAPKTLLNWIAYMIKSITGKSNWRTAPVKSIEALNNEKVNKAGDTMAGLLTAAPCTGNIDVVSGNPKLEVRSASSADSAYMLFHRPSGYAIHFGLDLDNYFKIGGYSAGANKYMLWDERKLRWNAGGYLEFNDGGTWKPVGGIKSVQRGVVTTTTATGDTTDNVTISAVDMNKAFVAITFTHVDYNITMGVRARLTSATNLELFCDKGSASSSGGIQVAYEVIESY